MNARPRSVLAAVERLVLPADHRVENVLDRVVFQRLLDRASSLVVEPGPGRVLAGRSDPRIEHGTNLIDLYLLFRFFG